MFDLGSVIFALSFILLVQSPEQKAPGYLSGEWEMEAQSGSAPRSFLLKLEQNGEGISGAVTERGVAAPIERGKFSENQLSFQVSYQGTVYQLKAALKSDRLEGTWDSGSSSGAWKAQRRPEASGAWQCWATSGETEDRAFILHLKQASGEITGTATSARGSAVIKKGSLKGNSIELAIATEEGIYTLTGTLEQGKLRGSWKRWDDRTGTWQGERQ